MDRLFTGYSQTEMYWGADHRRQRQRHRRGMTREGGSIMDRQLSQPDSITVPASQQASKPASQPASQSIDQSAGSGAGTRCRWPAHQTDCLRRHAKHENKRVIRGTRPADRRADGRTDGCGSGSRPMPQQSAAERDNSVGGCHHT